MLGPLCLETGGFKAFCRRAVEDLEWKVGEVSLDLDDGRQGAPHQGLWAEPIWH